MAGHFILKSLTHSDAIVAQTKGGRLSPRQHADIGWSEQSRNVLSTALKGGGIGNRDNLPPHVYLQFNATFAGNDTDKYLAAAGWADNLERPDSVGLGLRALSPAAQQAWSRGSKAQALAAQARHGAVSIEIYYQSGYEV